MAKKIMSPNELVRDLFVKMNTVYSKDMYIIYHKYIIPGPNSCEEDEGFFMLEISDIYREALQQIFFNHNVVLIPDIRASKDNFELFDDDERKEDELVLRVTSFLNNLKMIEMWHDVVDDFPSIIEDVFVNKLTTVFNITRCDKKEEEIEIGKNFLPLVTLKNVNDVHYSSSYDKDHDFYELHFLLDIPYGVFHSRFRYISLVD